MNPQDHLLEEYENHIFYYANQFESLRKKFFSLYWKNPNNTLVGPHFIFLKNIFNTHLGSEFLITETFSDEGNILLIKQKMDSNMPYSCSLYSYLPKLTTQNETNSVKHMQELCGIWTTFLCLYANKKKFKKKFKARITWVIYRFHGQLQCRLNYLEKFSLSVDKSSLSVHIANPIDQNRTKQSDIEIYKNSKDIYLHFIESSKCTSLACGWSKEASFSKNDLDKTLSKLGGVLSKVVFNPKTIDLYVQDQV